MRYPQNLISRISIVIPVRNEQDYLPRCLAAILQSAKKLGDLDLEVIVVLNRSTDASEQIARDSGCLIVNEDSKNLSKIRNAGVRKALPLSLRRLALH